MMNPLLLALALDAQKAFGSIAHIEDKNHAKGRSLSLDMLDILGAQLDKDKSTS